MICRGCPVPRAGALAALILTGCPVPASIMTSGEPPGEATGADESDTTAAGTTASHSSSEHSSTGPMTEPSSTTHASSEHSTTEHSTGIATTDAHTTGGTGDTGATGSVDCGEPELLADQLELPWSLSRQGAWIYFSTMGGAESETDGGIWRVPVDGGVPELLSDHPLDGRWLTTTPTRVFWSEYVGLPHSADLDGGDPQAVVDALVRPIAVDATHFYWATTHQIGRIPLANGASEVLADADFFGAYELALDDTRVFWTTSDSLETVAKDGSGRLTLAVDQAYAGAIGSDGEHVYWIDHTPCEVRRTPVTGGPIEALWTSDPQVLPAPCTGGSSELVLDGDHVYWGGNLSVQRVAKTGGAREVLFEGEQARYARDLLVDETHVYWLKHAAYCNQDKSCNTGALLRICKPA